MSSMALDIGRGPGTGVVFDRSCENSRSLATICKFFLSSQNNMDPESETYCLKLNQVN